MCTEFFASPTLPTTYDFWVFGASIGFMESAFLQIFRETAPPRRVRGGGDPPWPRCLCWAVNAARVRGGRVYWRHAWRAGIRPWRAGNAGHAGEAGRPSTHEAQASRFGMERGHSRDIATIGTGIVARLRLYRHRGAVCRFVSVNGSVRYLKPRCRFMSVCVSCVERGRPENRVIGLRVFVSVNTNSMSRVGLCRLM